MKRNTDTIKSLIDLLEMIGAGAHGSKTGEHSHKCPKCGHIWSHEDSCINDTAHHTCQCGTEQWYVYHDKREGLWQSCAIQSGVGREAEPKQSTERGE